MFTRPRPIVATCFALVAILAGCAPDAAAPSAEKIAEAAVAKGVTITNARIVLAPVAGNPAAVYFDLAYQGEPGVTLMNIAVEGAGMTMIHDYAETGGKLQMTMSGPVALSPEAPVSLAPGGLHGMAMEPAPELKQGSTARITLNFSDGTSASVDAPVKAAGDER